MVLLSNPLAVLIMVQLVDAIYYIHSILHFLHRDIKSANVPPNVTNDALLCEF